ncbi:MAG: DUF192 domain-containing protein [Acidobacteria bacterium]|nr:DUF192 domain-containing protein [Acidobacteriota bacterium]
MKERFISQLSSPTTPDLCIRNQRNGRVVASRILPALESKSRRSGLLGYDSLPDGDAMVIAPTNAVHTWFMRFPIDLAFVDREGRVIKTCHTVKPWRIAAAFRAFAVIELNAGTLARSETMSGDRLELMPKAGI